MTDSATPIVFTPVSDAKPRTLQELTKEELYAQQRLLESEIDANEEEIRAYQAELDQIYEEQDRRRDQAEASQA